jgi:hypothetical protein
MKKFLSNKAMAMVVITASFALAMNGELILGPALFYVYFLIVIVIAAKAYRSTWEGTRPFLAVIGFCSLFMVPALIDGIGRLSPDPDIIETREAFAPTLCPDYFKSSGWERYVQRRNTSWCRDYPQYDATNVAGQIDTETTASTKTTGNLWK